MLQTESRQHMQQGQVQLCACFACIPSQLIATGATPEHWLQWTYHMPAWGATCKLKIELLQPLPFICLSRCMGSTLCSHYVFDEQWVRTHMSHSSCDCFGVHGATHCAKIQVLREFAFRCGMSNNKFGLGGHI